MEDIERPRSIMRQITNLAGPSNRTMKSHNDVPTRYFVGIGSNIRPQQNTPLILAELQRKSPVLHISRIVQTKAVDMIDSEPFFNLVAAIEVPLDANKVKQWFNSIESRLGRDRAHPLRGQLGRTADLDIIFALENGETSVATKELPPEAHIRPMLLELLQYLKISGSPPANLPEPTPIKFQGQLVGMQATTLNST